MNKNNFMKSLIKARLKFEAALELVSDEQMEQPGVSGEMSVKDILGHVAWYEREMVVLLETMVFAGSPLWALPNPERNAAIQAEVRPRDLEEIVEESERVYQAVIDLLDQLEEAALNDPGHFKDMAPDWLPWKIIAGNTSEHYDDHAEDILKFLG